MQAIISGPVTDSLPLQQWCHHRLRAIRRPYLLLPHPTTTPGRLMVVGDMSFLGSRYKQARALETVDMQNPRDGIPTTCVGVGGLSTLTASSLLCPYPSSKQRC